MSVHTPHRRERPESHPPIAGAAERAPGGEGASRPVGVLVADNEPVVREFLAALIEREPTLELVALASDAEEALELAAAHRPDVAFVDVKMPAGGGERVALEIDDYSPQTRVVAFSAHDDREAVLGMVRLGVAGYVVKGASAAEIVGTIRACARGHGGFSAPVAASVAGELAAQLQREEGARESRRQRTARIRQVLDRGGPNVVFQPILDLAAGEVTGFEALARFEEGPANAVFEEAAAVGLGIELELAAVRAALAASEQLPPDAYLSLNLSPAAAVAPAFPQALRGVSPERIVIELTEHARVDDYDVLKLALRDLRAAGGRVAIDDAGAGFASLRHILLLEPDLIKLDVSLTRDIETDRARRALASALISFAREIDATIVAEGIENRAQLDALLDLGVTYGQGYYLGRPAPALRRHPSGWTAGTLGTRS